MTLEGNKYGGGVPNAMANAHDVLYKKNKYRN
jgi:hypothetical protein